MDRDGMDAETRAADVGTRERHQAVRSRRVFDLQRTLVGGGYMLSRTASGALLLEDAGGAPIATVRLVGA